MRILILSKSSNYFDNKAGGAETSLRLIAEKLAQPKHDVTYLTLQQSKTNVSSTINKVRVIFSSQNNFYSKLAETIVSKNIQIVYCFYELDILRDLHKIKKSYNKFKVVMRAAGLFWYEHIKLDKRIKNDYLYLFNSVDCVNFISKGLVNLTHDKAKELDIRFNFKNIFVGDIGVDTPTPNIQIKKQSNDTVLNLVVPTRFCNYAKRQDLLIDAIDTLRDKIDIRATFIGHGTEKCNIQNKINILGLQNVIKLDNYMSQDELWQYMKTFDLLCHPCDYEGLSKIILESMALGLPVLASNVTPLNTYIVDKKNGYLVDNNVSTWADKLIYIYNNRRQLKSIAKNAHNFILREYSADNNVRNYQNLFKELLV